jgi:hypothetical protein
MPLQAVGAVTSIASTVAQIQNAKEQTDIQRNLGYLDAAQRKELELNLQRTGSLNKRLEILANAAATVRAAQSSAILGSTINSKSKKETTTALIVVGGAIAILIAIVIIKKK